MVEVEKLKQSFYERASDLLARFRFVDCFTVEVSAEGTLRFKVIPIREECENLMSEFKLAIYFEFKTFSKNDFIECFGRDTIVTASHHDIVCRQKFDSIAD